MVGLSLERDVVTFLANDRINNTNRVIFLLEKISLLDMQFDKGFNVSGSLIFPELETTVAHRVDEADSLCVAQILDILAFGQPENILATPKGIRKA